MTLTHVNVMRPNKNLRDSLQHLRDDHDAPLMSEHDIERLIMANPVPTPQQQVLRPAPGTSTPWRWIVGATGLAAAATATIMLWPTDVPQTVSIRQDLSAPMADHVAPPPVPTPANDRRVRAQSRGDAASSSDIAMADEISTMQEAAEPLSAKATDMVQATTPRFQPTRTISLSASDLAALGLKHTGDALRYVEDGVTITVRTNGISATGERIPSDLRTPRHITLYRKGMNFARWMDRTAAPVDVNDLIGIQVWLRDPSKPEFQEADVILWYAPTDEVIDALPLAQRLQLRRELGSTTAPSAYVEHRTASASIASFVVAPNPVRTASASLLLDVRTSCTVTIRIIDMMAREVNIPLDPSYALGVGRETITLNGLQLLPNGMYNVIVDVPATQERVAHRLLIER